LFEKAPHWMTTELDMYKLCMRRHYGTSGMYDSVFHATITQWESLSTEEAYGDTPLWRAIISQNVEIVKLLIQHPSIDVNHTHDSSGYSLLTHAVHTRRDDIVKLLLDHPNIDLFPLEFRKEWHGWNDVMRYLPHIQVFPCMCEACGILIEEQRVEYATINKLLDEAYTSRGEYERKQTLWEAQNDKKYWGYWDETTTQRTKLRLVRRLIRRYMSDKELNVADDVILQQIDLLVRAIHRKWICSRDKNGDTLLIQLCRIPVFPTISYLVHEQRIPVNVGNDGWTPLAVAAHNNQEDTVKHLLTLNGIGVTIHPDCAETRSKYWILKHRAIQHEIRRLAEIELMSKLPRLNRDVQRYIAKFLLPKPFITVT
jgi:ankyrin repeat protein